MNHQSVTNKFTAPCPAELFYVKNTFDVPDDLNDLPRIGVVMNIPKGLW